ncbi:RES family NAD+ phosphorylase [Homoserinimonas sp. OAct 916]|uniref:RES family NAD+ phosphorylase n=1 Tax=Homoserinimonas sp. OAct 916 TaxID=2211450 RepID=UPI001300572D|nr:RES family NAD+ phosphorylase [Homoserinimonas sp. OAct 916]
MSASPRPKVAPTPPSKFVTHPEHFREYDGQLWRIFRSQSRRLYSWDQLREHGPVLGVRFDPHPLPPGDHAGYGVMYTSADAITAFAEVYQGSRVIDRISEAPILVGWKPTRKLELLDLTTNWPVLNTAAAAMMMDDKVSTQAWAREIYSQLGTQIDGLYHQSSIDNQPMITLFSRAKTQMSFPSLPSFNALLNHSAAEAIVDLAADRLGYSVI